ncbi:bifunctional 2',3'-cyclic-nucleotide 2'-phosphodiesterase/3'-nucleotidase [Lysinibacillus sp. 2017]|uniref:bifunctional 2',3'-cyclic-nucleotide 2'-phosphodiesterase/3'-nucleotidase n=1 Tax=unclassified Lysinibacillus TaxID=2636778 RepID=UPI000D529F9B|nr:MULTISPECIES: bifunctional 2',3'-cyclic-nucleotide 2'-phosphodiesterase/3'-nucleotidase [unclassified Lysinibacillus]AWE07384.1 bifunctional 2',3'-cyclic-nucleotide 2'-phosphodiesterase/3'-nucleotidase [Lysinibacillus sp. 2017]TGN36546.1 bifunctional 2',3'-cyclic-nucleotide 2'-phosphodiesterase/3'-nucleotidase [Lysinibacillus sp. S2017]
MWKKLSASALTLSLLASGMTVAPASAANDEEITRGEFVKAVIDALGVTVGSGKSVQFKDVPESLKPYIEKAIELKLINGKTPTQFAPDEKVSRSQAFIVAARGLQGDATYSEDVLNQFKDADTIAKANRQEMAKAVKLGLLKGYEDATIRPNNIVKKVELDKILERFLAEYSPVAANTTVALRILGTTDIHTNVVNYDYYKDTESNSLGLAKTALLIDEARKENPNTLLFDNGDEIQGTPLGSYMQSVKKLADGEIHPSIAAMIALDYDAATFGNHEFNYGLDFLDEVTDDATFPYVNANIRNATTKELMYDPYVMIEKEVVDSNGEKAMIKVGVTGIVPPQILKWDKSNLEGKVTVDDSIQAVKAIVPQMKEAGADVVVVLSHSGMGDATHEVGEEDVSYLMTEIKDVDAVISGHAHDVFPGKVDASIKTVDLEKGTMNGVPIVMAGKYGSHLGVIDLQLEKKGDSWDVTDGTGAVREISKDNSDVNQAVVDSVKEAHEGTIEYVRQAVGTTTATIHSYFSQVQDDPSIQIVTDAQTIYLKEKLKGTQYENLPVLSAGAPFKAGTRSDPDYYTYVAKGELAIKNVADLYLYDNTLSMLKVTGADVKEWLEMSAGQYNQIDVTKTEEQQLINADYRSYNYDVIDGVTYEIDVTQPAKYDPSGNLVNEKASRIVNLQYKGEPIDLKQDFIVATNNYRANGTFPGVRNATAVEIYPDENRQSIIDYILAEKTIDPSADGNWKFAPIPDNVKVVFESSKKAVNVLEKDSNIQFIGDGTDGFGKYLLKTN